MRLLEAAFVHMDINLRGGDVGMTKHFLNDTEVAAIVHQVTGESVAKGVGLDVLGDAGGAGVFLDKRPNVFAAHAGAAGGQEDIRLGTGIATEARPGFGEVSVNPVGGGFADRYDPFFAAFAEGAEETGFEVEVGEGEVGDFADAQAGRVHQFDHRLVAQTEFGFWLGRSEQIVGLLIRQGVWQVLPETRCVDVLGHVVGDEFFADEETEKHTDGGEASGDGADGESITRVATGGVAGVALGKEEVGDVLALDGLDGVEFSALEECDQFRQVFPVGTAGVFGRPALDCQVI